MLERGLHAGSGLGQRTPYLLSHHKCYVRSRSAVVVTAIATRPRAPAPLPDDVQALERSLQLDSTSGRERVPDAHTQIQAPGSSKRVLEQEEVFHSTLEHRLWVSSATALLSATLAKGLSEVHDLPTAVGAAAAALLAYYVSDFLTGVYHWGVDNYGSGETPLVGSQIAAFQGHHVRPWTITEREFCNNVHKVFKPAAPFAALCLLASPWTPAPLDVFLSTATFLTCMSQQFHAWAHMKRSELPPLVNTLQEAGVLVSRRAHGAHHRAPFEGNYCIVSGVWNPLLDAGGSDQGFFRRLERFVHKRTGVEPRCWHEPTYTWQEEQPPQA